MTKTKKLVTGLVAVLLLLLVSISCAQSSPVGQEDKVVPPSPPTMGVPPAPVITVPGVAPRPTTTPTPTPSPAPGKGGSSDVYYSSNQAATDDRMIIRTGNMSIVVAEIPAAVEQIVQLAGSYDGYVVSSQTWREGERLRGIITIRVAVGEFDNVMRRVAALAVEVTNQTTSSKDVTEEYTDLNARLLNYQATEKQLLLILEKAQKVEDILAVQRELTNVRQNIETTKGRMQYLERTSATSLLEVHLEQAKLEAKLTADRVVAEAGQGIRFNPQIAGGFAPYSYEWDFGDGGTSTAAAPSHSYKSSGSYTVTLKVTDDRGNTDSETRKDYINILPGWSPGNTLASAWNGLVTFGQVLGNIFIWVGIFSIIWVPVALLVWWRMRRIKKV